MDIKRIIRGIKHRSKELFRLWMFWKPDFLWLYRNRYLRMDANIATNDRRRRLFHLDRYEFAADCLKSKKAWTILDAACGTGYGSDILKKSGAREIIGVDISPEAVKYAQKKYGDGICSFKVSDITRLNEFEDSRFDAAVSFETIEHIAEPLVFLQNLSRLLKENGILIVSTPNKWGPTKDHKFDYDYQLLREHIGRFFGIEDTYVQNSGCMELWTNRGAPRRLAKATAENIEQAECFIAVCRKRQRYFTHPALI